MKNLTTKFRSALIVVAIIYVAIYLLSCFPQRDSTKNITLANTKGTDVNQVIIAIDESVSATTYNVSPNEIRDHYLRIAQTGGGSIAILRINSNSFNQEPYIIEVPPLDTNSNYSGSQYDRNRNTRANRKELRAFNAQLAGLDTMLSIKNEHKARFSDIKGALNLIDVLINPNAQFVNVILVTDLINDQPPKNGYDPFKKHKFPSSVNLHLIRPNTKVIGSPEALFDNAKIAQYANFGQIIRRINTQE